MRFVRGLEVGRFSTVHPFLPLQPRKRMIRTKAARESWDFGRFVKTVLFFNPPPSVGEMVSRIFGGGGAKESDSPLMDAPKQQSFDKDVVLFLGHENEIGKWVLQGLVDKGVRPCVLGSVPTVDMPEKLKFLDMKESPVSGPWLKAVSTFVICGDESGIWDQLDKNVFNPEKGVSDVMWGPLDDVVMGGCSQSDLTIQSGRGDQSPFAAIFRGNITSANNGGFASVRTKNFEPPMNLDGYDGMKIKVKGDGQRYKFMLRTTTDWDSVSYCKSFDTREGWQELNLDFEDFIPVFRAKSLDPPPPLELQNISSLQVMLSKFEYDGELNPSIKMGKFELPIEHIKAYVKPSNLPKFVVIDGGEQQEDCLKDLNLKYSKIDADKGQETEMRNSTFVQFCVEHVINKEAKEGTYKEKSRPLLDDGGSDSTKATPTYEELLTNFKF